ncbi:MAG: hypothetical protein RTV41_07165 [Candidatus Thorarchaeota archaeon]
MTKASRGHSGKTPLIFRTGLLYSYPLTFLMAGLVTLSGFLTALYFGLGWEFFADYWSIIWVSIWMGATYLVRRMVRGLVCLFGLPEKEDLKTWYPKEKILTQKCVTNYEETLAYAVAMKKDIPYSPAEREPIPEFLRALFEEDDDFTDYRTNVAKVLFSRLEIPLGIIFFVVYMLLWWIPTSVPWSFQGIEGHFLVDLQWYIVTGFWFLEALLIASFAKIYLAMLAGTYILGKKPRGLRIYKYLHFLDRRGNIDEKKKKSSVKKKKSGGKKKKGAKTSQVDEQVVDLEVFSKLTKPIGRVFTEVTVGFIGILVILDLYWLLLNPPEGATMIYPIITLCVVLLIFFLPQLGMHLMLEEYKTVINERLVRTRMFTNTRLIEGTSKLEGQTVGSVDKKLEPYISLHMTVIDVLDSMIEKVNKTSTWPIDTSMVFKLSSGAIFDLILVILGVL